MLSGVSTLGVKVGYNKGTTKPTKFLCLHRINSIAEISLSPETIDSSALEDLVTRTIQGRADTGSTFDVVFNATDETIAEWKAVQTMQEGLTTGESIWLTVWAPGLKSGAFFVKVQVPKLLNMPAFDQNGLLTMTISLTIEDYVGFDTAIEPVESLESE